MDFKQKLLYLIYSILLILAFVRCESITSVESTPYVVIMFDDAYQSVYENALPILQRYHYPATNAIPTGRIGKERFMTWKQVCELENFYHWETAGHTLNHRDLTTCTDEELELEIGEDQQNLISHDLSHDSFAIPFGRFNASVLSIVKKYYKYIRCSHDYSHYSPLSNQLLGYYSYSNGRTPEDVKSRLIQGINRKESLIILGFHSIDQSGGAVNCTPENFQKTLDYINELSLPVYTLSHAMNLLSE